ncbi:unnamed protein product [Schistocephalus solidus]|uniref:Heterogeneous nuclear ribonucleoprotein K n=1 Tax=Schistocephalus solidus TaxID=70667 RepID=A0A183TQ54_SCHSO|nr:unnamed protein product [Schistocephalus solidus]
MREGPNVELRFLISSKVCCIFPGDFLQTAGLIIGKRGESIKKLREEIAMDRKGTILAPRAEHFGTSCETILILEGDVNSVIEIMHNTLNRVQNIQEDCVDVRLLVHQSQAGCIIGKGGTKIKELREQSVLKTLKVYQMLCPSSTDRVVQLVGSVSHVVSCLQAITELLEGAPPKGPRQNYDARSYDEDLAHDYGGWCMMGMGASSGGFINRRNNLASNHYNQGSVLAAGLFSGVSGAGANPRTVSQAAAVSQALASGLPHASAAAMLAATGGQNPGAPASGPAGDAAAAAAMMAAGMMRGMSGRVGMNIIAPTTTTQVSVGNKMIGAIMGRGGSRINQVRKESGADIKISPQEPGVEDRIITITGTPDQIQSAQFYLQLW